MFCSIAQSKSGYSWNDIHHMSFYTSYKFRFWRYLVTWSWWLSHHDTWWPADVDVVLPGDEHVAAHPLCPVSTPAPCLAATALKYKLWNLSSANHSWQDFLKILYLTWYMKSRPWNLQAPYQVQVPASSLWVWAFKETAQARADNKITSNSP